MPMHPAAPDDRNGLIDAFDHSVQSIIDLGHSCRDEDFEIQTECPGWTVKDQIAHIVGAEKSFAGMPRPQVDVPDYPHVHSDFARYVEVDVEARRGMSGREVVAEPRRVPPAARRRPARVGRRRRHRDRRLLRPRDDVRPTPAPPHRRCLGARAGPPRRPRPPRQPRLRERRGLHRRHPRRPPAHRLARRRHRRRPCRRARRERSRRRARWGAHHHRRRWAPLRGSAFQRKRPTRGRGAGSTSRRSTSRQMR